MTNQTSGESPALSRQRLVDLVVFEYRSLVVRRLGVTAEWRVLEWTDAAACANQDEATLDMCQRCPVAAECLAAAVASDTVGLRYCSADDEDDAVLDAWDWDIEVLIERYKTEYQAYAERFTLAATAAGQAISPPISVRVTADANPTSTWRDPATIANPNEYESDELSMAIWHAAHDAIPLPNVDIKPAPVADGPAPGRR